MTKTDIDNIISIICPNDEDFEKSIISPAYLKKELEALALEQEPCGDLISRKAVCDYIAEFINHEYSTDAECEMVDLMIKGIQHMPPVKPQEPSGETVSLEVFKQVMWERDIAIEQLKELGYGFGQKIEPKTGHWIATGRMFIDLDGEQIVYEVICDQCKGLAYFRRTMGDLVGAEYCPCCGVKMEGEQNG